MGNIWVGRSWTGGSVCPGSKGGQQHPGLYDQEHNRRTREGMLWNIPSRFQIPNSGMLLASRSGLSRGTQDRQGLEHGACGEGLGELGLSSPEKGRLMGS